MIIINGIQVAAPDVYKVTIADLDASANRSGNGTLFRDRVAVKRTIDLSWYMMDGQDLSVLLTNVSSVFFPVTYLDPVTNSQKTGTFYVSDRSPGVAVRNADGSYTWKEIAFSLVER
jgi:hypothetical protein